MIFDNKLLTLHYRADMLLLTVGLRSEKEIFKERFKGNFEKYPK